MSRNISLFETIYSVMRFDGRKQIKKLWTRFLRSSQTWSCGVDFSEHEEWSGISSYRANREIGNFHTIESACKTIQIPRESALSPRKRRIFRNVKNFCCNLLRRKTTLTASTTSKGNNYNETKEVGYNATRKQLYRYFTFSTIQRDAPS